MSRLIDVPIESVLTGQPIGPCRHRGQSATAGSWLARMMARKPRMLVAIALANKIARVAWALMATGGVYRVHAAA